MPWRRTFAVLLLIASPSDAGPAQTTTVEMIGDTLHVRAPDLKFVKEEALRRLKDGRSVRFDFQFEALSKPGAAAKAQSRESFILSYDLWEERFAVTQITASSSSPPAASQSVSHLSAGGAEAWCVERLGISSAALGGLGRDDAIWIRVTYQMSDPDEARQQDDAFSIRGLIDRLSRRGRAADDRESIEAGPFRINRK